MAGNDREGGETETTRRIRHVAIIMDGNGRWAKQRGLPRTEGHKRGVETVRDIIEAAREIELEFLTLYAFSAENWKRPKDEVQTLMNILRSFLLEHGDEFHEKGIRLRTIGRTDELPAMVRIPLRQLIKRTAANTGGQLVVALNYGGRVEIVDAARALAKDARDGAVRLNDIDEARFASYLYAPDIPDPDLLIRTSGETRLSNFLLWQLSYAELYFTRVLWPDFSKTEFKRAIEDFTKRDRRFGSV